MEKSLRSFSCRDDLWARVEALADRRGVSADDVVQAALVKLFSRPTVGVSEKAVTEPPAARRPTPPPRATMPATSSVPSSSAPTRPRAPSSGGLPRPPGGGRLPPPTGRFGSGPPTPAPAAANRALYLVFEGQVYEVNQDQFVIGRGSKYSDLAIKDANISRRHCAIVRRDGQYYIKDLESTNGVEFNGQRVDDHLIQEGTSYRLCDHEIRFTFVPPA